MENFSKAGMLSFAEMMTTKGWINANTGGGYKAALKKVLADLPDDTDVRKIDVKTQVLRYNNLNPGELSPASLKQYEKRVAAMIGYFVSWKTDPTNFKPPQREPGERSAAATTTGKVIRRTRPASATAISPERPAVNGPNGQGGAQNARHLDAGTGIYTHASGDATLKPSSLTMPFPLRDDYLAQITIPRDMTKDEADRLCTFIQALARA